MIKSVYVVNCKVSHLVVCVKVGALNSSISLLSFIENLNHQFYWWVPALLSGQVGGD